MNSHLLLNELTTLHLAENQLTGPIPSWLMNLTQLTVLDLAGNILEGPIPSSLFELANLETLYLHSNHLNGTVEFNILFKLKNLVELQLSDNNMS